MATPSSLLKILILGGTGPLGILGVKTALSKGHEVYIYARTPSKLPGEITNNPNARIIQGDLSVASIEAKLVPILPSVTTILSYLGPNTFPGKGTPYLDFWNTLLPHIRALQSPPYLVVLSTVSIVDPNDTFSILYYLMVLGMRLFGGTVWPEIQSLKDLWNAEKKLDWTIFRVGWLDDRPLGNGGKGSKAGWVAKDDYSVKMGRWDIAEWSVREAENKEWVGKMPALYSVKGT